MQRLNPYASVAKRNAILNEEKQKKARQTLYDQRRGVSTVIPNHRLNTHHIETVHTAGGGALG